MTERRVTLHPFAERVGSVVSAYGRGRPDYAATAIGTLVLVT
jgi:hypothetical protein